MTTRIMLVAILISQLMLAWLIIDVADAVKRQPILLTELKADIQHLTHPQTIQRRTIEYILRQGEFEGVQ